MSTAVHLAFKEIARNKGRFLLFSLVIALITLLILFIAALGEGLGSGNREYLENLDAELIVYQSTARLSIASSQIDLATRRMIRSVDGVEEVAPVGFGSAAVPRADSNEFLDVALIGVEPGMPGEPQAVEGRGFERIGADEALIDRTVALIGELRIGDPIVVRTVIDGEDEFHTLTVVGVCDSQKYGLRSSVFVPKRTWDNIRPQVMLMGAMGAIQPIYNVLLINVADSAEPADVIAGVKSRVSNLEIVDPVTAYENTPGYSEQQTTLATQNGFALLIGALVIGGFFQIQTMQKVPQIGMLKAIGTPNGIIALSSILQIFMVNLAGILIGAAVTYGLALVFPPGIPIVFELRSAAAAIASILIIGPVGGIVSVRYSLRVEPLTALGLNS